MKSSKSLDSAAPRNLWIALVFLMVSLTITAFAALDIKADVEAAAQA